nr:FecR family protein [Muricauda sp. UBA7809]|tara:strand:+ start:6291 stop:7454 length:1164 start_codon:yes stop_codon:yes gene_type:complete
MHKKETLRLLLKKKLEESTSWKNKPNKDLSKCDEDLLDSIIDNNLVNESLSLLEDLDVETDWKRVEKRLCQPKVRKLRPKRTLVKYAAIFLGLISLTIGYILVFNEDTKGMEKIYEGDYVALDIGSEIIAVDNHGSHSIELTDGTKVAVHNGDTLIYDVNEDIEGLVFNELSVPNGKLFTLILSDGTEIHLNSGTKIRFPVNFPKVGNREVYVYGEAYFDVTKDSLHPFIVNSKEVAIKVLGTEFNFSSYNEQKEVVTVLVEGSVSINHVLNSMEEVILEPGQKGAWNRDKKNLSVTKVDTSLYTSWVSGEIVLRDTPFSELITTLERVYNVKILNTNIRMEKRTFNARFNRNIEGVVDVLEGLKLIVPFDYELKRENENINQITIK